MMLAFLPILAEISAQDVGQIIVTLISGGCIGAGAYMTGKAKAVHIQPQPLEVTASKEYATREELEQLREDISEDLNKVYDKLNKTSEQLASNTGTLNQINSTLNQLLNRHLKA